MLIALLMFLIILPSCDIKTDDFSNKDGERYQGFNLLGAEFGGILEGNEHRNSEITSEHPSATSTELCENCGGNYSAEYDECIENECYSDCKDEYEPENDKTVYVGDVCDETEVWIIEHENVSDGEFIDESETVYYADDLTEDTEYMPPIEMEPSFYALYMYEYCEDIMRVIRSIRCGYDGFVTESVKTYGGNGRYYAGLDSISASIIAEGLLNTPLVIPKEDVNVEYFGIVYYPKENFLAISYRINFVSYVFRYEAIEHRSDWHLNEMSYLDVNLDGIEFKLHDSEKGNYIGCLDHSDLSNRYIVMMISGENPDFSQFEFIMMQGQ